VRVRTALTAALVLGVVFGLGYYLVQQQLDGIVTLPAGPQSCVVGLDRDELRLDPEQVASAATIAAVGIRRELPRQAITVALATALQESKLRNLGHLGGGNDHDSLGLFQQRPSQGWGAEEDIMQPRYAADAFYTALLKVDGWEGMPLAQAAQEVQRSAYPDAYAKWEDEAQVLSSALTGQRSGAVSCTVDVDAARPSATPPRTATALNEQLKLDWGPLALGAVAAGDGLRVPVTENAGGWQISHWMVAHATTTGVTRVQFADQQWSADDGTWSAVENVTEQVVVEVRNLG
jgi:hypothetical protein